MRYFASYNIILRSAVALGAIGLPASAALAQEESAPSVVAAEQIAQSEEGIGEIIVTARRVEENLQDVPVAVTAFSRAQLESKNVTLLSDVGVFTPGFSMRQSPGNATAATLALRGQAQNEILATLDPSVGTYVDEMYWARAYGLNSSILDVANIQVLKGPQGTLFGRNTTGGALLVTTADPDFDGFSARASFTYGRLNEASAEVALNVPASNNVAFRGAFRISHRDGWAYGIRQFDPATDLPANQFLPNGVISKTGERFNGRDELQGRLKALLKFSDTTSLLLSGEWYDADINGTARQLRYKINLNAASDNVAARSAVLAYQDFMASHPNAVGYDAFDCNFSVTQPAVNCDDNYRSTPGIFLNLDTQTYLAKLVSNLSDAVNLKLIGGYRAVKSDSFFDTDGSSTLIHSVAFELDLEQWSAEAQLSGALFGGALDYVVGATYFTESGVDRSFSLSSGPGGDRLARATRNYGDIDNQSWGIYGQGSYAITSALTFTGGLRYSRDKKGLEIRSANVNLAGVPTGFVAGPYVRGSFTDPCNAAGVGTITGATPQNDCAAFRSDSFSAVSFTAGLDYRITDNVMAYAKISRGYRSGGQNLRAFNDAQFQPFGSEILNEKEVGFKADLFDRHVRMNVAAYRNVLSDAQLEIIKTTGITNNTLIDNAGKIRNLGIEADLTVRPVADLTLSVSGSINDADILEFTDDVGDRSDRRLPLVAKYQFVLSGQYQTQITNHISAMLNVDYSWTSKIANDGCVVTGLSACYAGTPDVTGRTAEQISRDIFEATTQDSAGILGARLTFGFNEDKYKLSIWGRNITGDRGFVQNTRLIAPQRNYVSGIRRDPATYGVTAAMNF